MPDAPPFAIEEYRALRATIRERGTVRLVVVAVTFLGWAALSIAVLALVVVPVVGLIPLAVLAAGFEIVFATHVGVERIGRYLQAKYETAGGLPGWEHAAMELGAARLPASGIDPLFSGMFTVAVLLNLVPIGLLGFIDGPAVGIELAMLAGLHLLVLARIVHARKYAAGQRARELPLFRGPDRVRG